MYRLYGRKEQQMTRTEFIKELRAMADAVEKGTFGFLDIGGDYIFANRNYGEFKVKINDHTTINTVLFEATDEEKKGE